MIIPHPRFEPLTKNLSGLSLVNKIKEVSKPPRFCMISNWTITLDDGVNIVIPQWFITDFASVPRLFWLIPGFSPYGPLLTGSILHDFAYQHGYLLADKESLPYPVRETDLTRAAQEIYPKLVPVFVGRDHDFFDNVMMGIVIEVTGAIFVANTAKAMLGKFGGIAWDNYRNNGPDAYGCNSLGLPGRIDGVKNA